MPTGYRLRWRRAPRPALRFRVGLSMAFALPEGEDPAPVAVVIGPRGPSAAGSRYEHVQASPSDAWTINHNLGVRPVAVTVRSTGGVEVEAQVTHLSDNQCVINFAVPFAGTAHVI